ncbi:GNAT family N-acetyltransferase [Flavobacterium hydatis]|uniref:GNAT family acetyltransferase n=1 Tax=Flavobacterium hydatis TaxID=991 RepID=A0A085ZGW2_FLAHY|nr:GNAT family N-acetyltransferase [Flavobacterium hydatis]KFF03676.1 GNAT family acetyltransferase [Flavobacterium hydatis]OXA92408.1 N-acetyltransferase [Flavobacterium hydatis]
MVNRSFTPFPILATERLTLRQLSTEDGQDIFALRSDAEINKYLGRQPSRTIEEATHFINKINDSIKKNDSIYWAITLTNSSIFVGTICLFDFSDETNKCEIGYELLTNFHGQGIMQEATKKVIDYAFQTLQVKMIEALTHNDNLNSIKLLTKFDFKKSIETDNETSDCSIFILKNSL